MAIETFLAIASFSISLGGLVSVFVFKDRTKEIALSVIVAALLATTGITLYGRYQHERLISRVQDEIVSELSAGTLTFDQLFQGLHYVSFPIVSEALFRAVEGQIIQHQVIEFQKDGKTVVVRAYFVDR